MTIQFHPRRLGHVNLWVHDLERSIRFYETVCGIALVRRERDILIGFHSNGNTHHDVGLIETSKGFDRIGRDGTVQIPKTRGMRVGLNHLGWEMENEAELVSAYRRALEVGAPQYRTLDHLISHSVYVSDPDGNVHEFYADAIPDWRVVYNLERDDEVTALWDPLKDEPSDARNYVAEPRISKVPGARLNPSHLTGATMTTSSFDAMTTFFLDVAGLVLVDRREDGDARVATFAGGIGRPDLTLVQVSRDARNGLQSFTFDLVDIADMDALRDGLQRIAGVEAQIERGTRDALVLHDPDGFELRFTNPVSEASAAPL
ncbi:putative Dioxygenase [Paraburkholderia piptadeniae]|uniref:Dioxygenase n=1 Tax=Paraburkholderia piptadeniae TaxID=1701573 RepID=A0A1N7S084_9BURK|nr:VOC family protein [Paraburkholderia piptadeniae]SIT40723.1 putative Dioxygenase [Paraburkholderia piptadeniae]